MKSKPLELTLRKPIAPEKEIYDPWLTPDIGQPDVQQNSMSDNEQDPWLTEQEQPTKSEQKSKSFFNNAMDYEKAPGLGFTTALGLGLAQGFGDVGASIGNVPSNLIKYLTNKEPYHIPHPSLQKYYPEGRSGDVGSKIGEVIGGMAFPMGGAATAAFKAARIVPGLPKYAAQLLGGAAGGSIGGALSNEYDRLKSGVIGAALGTAGSAIPLIYRGAKGIYNWIKEPQRALAEHKAAFSHALQNIDEAGEQVNFAQSHAANVANTQHVQSLRNERESQQQIQRLFPNWPLHQITASQHETMREGIDHLREMFNTRYNHFNQHGGGQNTIARPYALNQIRNDLTAAGANRGALQRMGNGLSPHEIELAILDEAGRPYRITVPARNSNVSSVVEYIRSTRDAANAARRQAKHAPRAEQLELRNQANALQRLYDDAEQRISHSVSPEQMNNFRKIQHDYRTLMVPFNESRTLNNIYYRGEYSPDLLTKMQSSNRYPLHQYLLQNNPRYRESLIAQRFSGKGHFLQPETLLEQARKITNLGRTEHEAWDLLSPNQQQALQHHVNVSQHRGYNERLKDSIKQNQLDQMIHAAERSSTKGMNPRTAQALNSIEHAQNYEQELIRQAKSLGLQKDELQKMMEQRKHYRQIAETGLKLVGTGDIMTLLGKHIY